MKKILNLLGWTGFGIFLIWTLCLLTVGNFVSAILTAMFAFIISPLRKKIFNKFNFNLSGKWIAIISCFLFFSSCGTFLGLTEIEEPSEETSIAVVENADSTTREEVVSEVSEIKQKDTDVTETSSESIKESAKESTTSKTITNSTDKSIESTVAESPEETTISVSEKNNVEEDSVSEMQVHFIDVGQGDATLITCDGEAMLIDAGDNSKGTTVQLYLSKQGVKELKYLILTHPDADHIGGADVVVTKFDIDTVFMSDYTKDNKTYEELSRALDDKGLKGVTPNVGNSYSLGSAEFTFVAPNTTYSDPNNSSLGLLLTNGDSSFLFTGDAEEEAEYDILANGLDIDCDVYKAGHHGSKTASTKDLLEAASPTYIVVSCAEGNSYGHPHAEPMNNFRSMGMKLFRTDEQGSVIATSNGTEITWNCAPSETWIAGESTESSTTSKASSSNTEKNEPATASKEASASTEIVITPSETDTTVVKEPEITPAPEPVPTPEPAADVMVWKSATGKKYHNINDCGNMNPDKATQITKAEAESLGLGPCSKCW